MIQLMKDCWIEEPERRPEIKEIRAAIKNMGKGKQVASFMTKYVYCILM